MNRELQLSDQEFQELDLLVSQALRSSEVELRHTVTFAYKDRVRQRIAMLERIAAKMEQAWLAQEPPELRQRVVA